MEYMPWLPEDPTWREKLRRLAQSGTDSLESKWEAARELARSRCDFVMVNLLDRTVKQLLTVEEVAAAGIPTLRIALLASCTIGHLFGAIRVAGLRHGYWLEIYEPDYGQFAQELNNKSPRLRSFQPNVVVFSLDASYFTAGAYVGMSTTQAQELVDERLETVKKLWLTARAELGSQIVHQLPLQVNPLLLGSNEHRLPGSPVRLLRLASEGIRALSDIHCADLLSIDELSCQSGTAFWHDRGLWHRAKQEVAPRAAPIYGEMLVRVLAAHRGRSRKCLVLDLDNTLWGGVVGEDGLQGLELGQGSPLGEAYHALQSYIKALAGRGVILAVCSKNDESTAREAFARHPEMVLKPEDIACFVANWEEKPANIEAIARNLNIGLDSLVFLDDNPAERALVRQRLPMVSVVEVTDDPVEILQALAGSGEFESVGVTDDDRKRGEQYQTRQEVCREQAALVATGADPDAYLRSLSMEMKWRHFDELGLKRVVQLINKTNQFNLRIRRYSEDAVRKFMLDPSAICLQVRLQDRFGDSGVVAVCIGVLQADSSLFIDTWLMSCRVIGRMVEFATLNLLAAQAGRRGARRLIGEYLPTHKNQLVCGLLEKFGFSIIQTAEHDPTRYALDLDDFSPLNVPIVVTEG